MPASNPAESHEQTRPGLVDEATPTSDNVPHHAATA